MTCLSVETKGKVSWWILTLTKINSDLILRMLLIYFKIILFLLFHGYFNIMQSKLIEKFTGIFVFKRLLCYVSKDLEMITFCWKWLDCVGRKICNSGSFKIIESSMNLLDLIA